MNAKATPYVPLSSENAALVLHRPPSWPSYGRSGHSRCGSSRVTWWSLAKAMRILKVPTVATTTARDSMWGPTFPELVAALPDTKIIDRSTVNVWDDPKVAAAIEATGRRKLILAGLSLEVCAAPSGNHCDRQGLREHHDVPVDACGTFSQAKHEAGTAADAAGGSDLVRIMRPWPWKSLWTTAARTRARSTQRWRCRLRSS